MISYVGFGKSYEWTYQELCGHCSPCDRSAWPASWPCLSPPSAPWSVLNQRNLRKSRKFLNFDTDPVPTFHFEADPDPVSYLSNAPLRPMVHRPSTSPFWASTAPQFWLRCGSGSSFPLWCRSESGFPKWWGSESALLLGSGNTVILTGSSEGSEMRILAGRGLC